MNARTFGWAACAVLAALGIGWVWGASGKSTIDQERRQLQQRADGSSAEADILDGRVALLLVNFGDAGRHFEKARLAIERMQTRFREIGQAERAGRLEVVLAHLKDAQRQAALLDQSAQNAAVAALQALRAAEQ